MVSPIAHVKFDAAAVLRKWPSLRGQRSPESRYLSPYMVLEGSLDECLWELMSKPASQRDLYEIHTSPQEPVVSSVIKAEHAAELARVRGYR